MIALLSQPFRRLWFGQQSLANAFWFYGFVVYLAVFSAWAILRAPMRMLNLNGLAAGLTTLLAWSYAVLLWVGIWRSATAYRGPKFWAVAAKVIVCLIAVGMVRGFFKNGGFDNLFGHLVSSN